MHLFVFYLFIYLFTFFQKILQIKPITDVNNQTK